MKHVTGKVTTSPSILGSEANPIVLDSDGEESRVVADVVELQTKVEIEDQRTSHGYRVDEHEEPWSFPGRMLWDDEEASITYDDNWCFHLDDNILQDAPPQSLELVKGTSIK